MSDRSYMCVKCERSISAKSGLCGYCEIESERDQLKRELDEARRKLEHSQKTKRAMFVDLERLQAALDKQVEDHQADVELLCDECMNKVLERAGFTRENVAEFVQTVKDTVDAAIDAAMEGGAEWVSEPEPRYIGQCRHGVPISRRCGECECRTGIPPKYERAISGTTQ